MRSFDFTYKLDLTDVSFLLPVRIDSPDRYRNLLLILRYLTSLTDTHILLLEADQTPKISSHLLKKGIDYFFVEDVNEKFHRTRYINQLAGKAVTPYLCICDADVVVPVGQLAGTINLLREGYAYVLPYDGSLVATDEEEKQLFMETLDCRVFAPAVLMSHVCGGAIFLNRTDFIRAGMSNENITSWGPDDVEQKKRMEILGFSMARVKGCLFHLCHPRGLNSSYGDADERIRLTEEYVKVASLHKIELSRYIQGWKWTEEYRAAEKEPSPESYWQAEHELDTYAATIGQDCTIEKGMTGVALAYLCLGQYDENDRCFSKAVDLLDRVDAMVSRKLPEGKVGMAWAIGIMREKFNIPDRFERMGRDVHQWLFTDLKAPGGVRIAGTDGIIFITWYYYFLLTDSCREYYNPVYYKEQLIFVTDCICDLLIKARRDRGECDTDVSLLKAIGQTLLLIGRLKLLGVNAVKTAKIETEVERMALEYLRDRGPFQQADGWLLYGLLYKADETGDSQRHAGVLKWCDEYLRECAGEIRDPQLSRIKEVLYKSSGIEKMNPEIPGKYIPAIWADLNGPAEWAQAWLFI